MTVRTQGYDWWRRQMDRRGIVLFQRVEAVELSGNTIRPEHLRLAGQFAALRSLVINDTGLSREDVGQWEREHPGIKVFYIPKAVVANVR